MIRRPLEAADAGGEHTKPDATDSAHERHASVAFCFVEAILDGTSRYQNQSLVRAGCPLSKGSLKGSIGVFVRVQCYGKFASVVLGVRHMLEVITALVAQLSALAVTKGKYSSDLPVPAPPPACTRAMP